MKTYISRVVKWLALLAVISVAILVTGIFCIIINTENVGLQVGPTVFGGLMTILFLSCFFAEKSRLQLLKKIYEDKEALDTLKATAAYTDDIAKKRLNPVWLSRLTR